MNNHYFKSVVGLNYIDVYRICELYGLDNAKGHALKKILCSGVRNGGKSEYQDIQEAIDTLKRWQDIYTENKQNERS